MFNIVAGRGDLITIVPFVAGLVFGAAVQAVTGGGQGGV